MCIRDSINAEYGISSFPNMSKALSRDKLVKTVSRASDFKRAIKYRGLTVVEVYSRTWGACCCIFPKLREIYKEYMDRPVMLVAAEADEIPALAEYLGKSKPVFLIYKKQKLLDKVEGVNAPGIERAVGDHAPTRDELATTKDDPDSEDDGPAPDSGAGRPRRSAGLATGLGRRRSLINKH
eukprot:TRINITY_DN54790_c0_g1_i1.p1 TRINITY_DN54790_c0_g1~~TRINITY_DN54790_c0_g1_i1.p1  ORF type:complete len:181 (-),score=43.37 TRINITY_DN54790_c0_g1_i1:357-899(-)